MSCKISRRNFMRCAGIGALALASTSLLGGCTTIDAAYGLTDAVTFTDKNGGSLTLSITRAVEIAAGSHEDMAEDYRLNIDETQRYVYLHMEVVTTTPARRSSCTTSATPSTGWRAPTPTRRSGNCSTSPTTTRRTLPAPPTPTPTMWCVPPRCSGPTTTACT